MVKLFLSEPSLGSGIDGSSSKEGISLLQKLESVIWSVVTSGGRSEARLWLCTTISCINSVSSDDQCELFVDLLRSKPQKHALAAQVLQMIFERRPRKAGSIIAKRSYMLEKFFDGHPRRILQWFGHFAGAGESEHRKGARAISQFAFVNRDICWDELEWKGKHGQSPAMVATKPHYFLDLDVLRTIENFIENVSDFWSSDELAESLRDGEIFRIDIKFFVDLFAHLLYDKDSDDVWAIISEFFVEEQFSFLCQHILILLDERELLAFLSSLSKFLCRRVKCRNFSSQSFWLENLLLTCTDRASIDELLLLNSLINQGRQLLRFFNDDEHEAEKGEMEELSESIMALSDADHWALVKECTMMNKAVAMKWLGLRSWAIHYSLSNECKSPAACESLFIGNGIGFQKSGDHSLICPDGFSKGSGSDSGDVGSIKHRRKKKAKSNKRRRKKYYSGDDSSDDELLELEELSGWKNMQSGGGSWLLSTDGYSCPWNTADLPEHLARYCFSMWMKWVDSRWTSST